MSDVVIGSIEKVSSRTTTQYGDMYDVDVNGKRYGCGKIKPKFIAGDCVKFTVTRNGNFVNVKPGTMEKHDVAESTPDSGTVAALQTVSAGWPNIPPPGAVSRTYEGKEDNRQNSIVLQSARKDAIEVTKLLLQADSLGFTAKHKWADKHDIVLAKINDLTRTFFHNTNDWKAFTGPTPPKVSAAVVVEESSE